LSQYRNQFKTHTLRLGDGLEIYKVKLGTKADLFPKMKITTKAQLYCPAETIADIDLQLIVIPSASLLPSLLLAAVFILFC
jgi:hypothetical protein